MRKLLLFTVLFLALPVSAQAASDIIATYKYSDGSMVTLCTRDSQHVRMDTSPTSYMLLSGEKIYSVSRNDDGTWQAIDMDQMKSMGSGFTSMFGGGSTPDYEVRYEKTGKSEKIAGYNGNVYNAVVFEDGKVVSRDEVVLGQHSNLKKLTDGWMAVASRMTNLGSSFEDCTSEAKKMGYGGMLRFGEDMRLASLKIKKLNSSYYKLPSNTKQVKVQQPPQQQTSGGGLSDDAKEIGEDAKQATKDEIKDSIRNTISDLFN